MKSSPRTHPLAPLFILSGWLWGWLFGWAWGAASCVCLLSPALAQGVSDPSYTYPYHEPFLASVSEVFLSPLLHNIRDEEVPWRRDRQNVALLEGRGNLTFGFYHHDGSHSAPLIVFLSGLGGYYRGPSTQYLGELFYTAGYDVITMTSAMNWSFVLSSSSDGYVGFAPDDALDILQAIKRCMAHVEAEYGIRFSPVELVGFSLGALDAAFVSKIDSEPGQIGFKRTVLINPPVDTLYGIRTLDRLFARGDRWSPQLRDDLVSDALGLLEAASDPSAPHDGSSLLHLDREIPFTTDQLQYLIGYSYRLSLADDIFASQQIDDRHVLRNKATRWNRTAREIEAAQYGFMDYARTFLMPAWSERHHAPADLDRLGYEASLRSIAPYLHSNPEIYVMTNADDFLLQPGDALFLQRTLGPRLYLYPYGGHGGNIWFPRNQRDLLDILGR